METIRRLRAELEAWFARLAPRERLMVSVGAGAAALFVVLMTFIGVQRSISRREVNIDRKTQVLAQVGKLAQGYRLVKAQQAQLESRLKTPLQLMSFVAQTGQRLGIEVTDLRPGPAAAVPASDRLTEESVEVNLAHLELQRLATLLQNLERGPGVVKIRRLALRSRNDDPMAVDATIVIATYRLKG